MVETDLYDIVHRVLRIDGKLVKAALLHPFGSLFCDCTIWPESEELISARYASKRHWQQFASYDRPCANAANDGDENARLFGIAGALSEKIVTPDAVEYRIE